MTEPPMLVAAPKPGKVQTVAVLTLISGLTNILWPIILYTITSLATVFVGCLFLPFFLPPMVLGIFEIIYAARILPDPIKPAKPSQTIAILEIISLLTGNLVSAAAGIVALVLYSDPEVKTFFEHAEQKAEIG
jgi:hypothetical protein